MTSITEEYLIVEISKKSYAINICYIESIHSSASIKFNEELNRCLPLPEADWDKSYPVFTPENSSNNENTTSFSKHSSRVVFLLDNQTGRCVAVIVDAIRKVLDVSVEKGNKNINGYRESNKQISLDNEEVTVFDIRKVFMT